MRTFSPEEAQEFVKCVRESGRSYVLVRVAPELLAEGLGKTFSRTDRVGNSARLGAITLDDNFEASLMLHDDRGDTR